MVETCIKKHCWGRHSGLGLLKATSTLESYNPLSHDTSSFSLPPNKFGCFIQRLPTYRDHPNQHLSVLQSQKLSFRVKELACQSLEREDC